AVFLILERRAAGTRFALAFLIAEVLPLLEPGHLARLIKMRQQIAALGQHGCGARCMLLRQRIGSRAGILCAESAHTVVIAIFNPQPLAVQRAMMLARTVRKEFEL